LVSVYDSDAIVIDIVWCKEIETEDIWRIFQSKKKRSHMACYQWDHEQDAGDATTLICYYIKLIGFVNIDSSLRRPCLIAKPVLSQ